MSQNTKSGLDPDKNQIFCFLHEFANRYDVPSILVQSEIKRYIEEGHGIEYCISNTSQIMEVLEVQSWQEVHSWYKDSIGAETKFPEPLAPPVCSNEKSNEKEKALAILERHRPPNRKYWDCHLIYGNLEVLRAIVALADGEITNEFLAHASDIYGRGTIPSLGTCRKVFSHIPGWRTYTGGDEAKQSLSVDSSSQPEKQIVATNVRPTSPTKAETSSSSSHQKSPVPAPVATPAQSEIKVQQEETPQNTIIVTIEASPGILDKVKEIIIKVGS